ncbi:MAG: translocase, partial [Planctomycetota bacterium]
AERARELEKGEHFKVDPKHRDLELTAAGRRRVDELCADLQGPWRGQRFRREMMHQALTARHLFLAGDQYVVQEGKVVIIDEATGRLMPDRTWRAGLHQAVEAKEGVEVQGMAQTLAAVSFQRFFRMYRSLAGTTGTAWGDRAEVWRTYRMHTVRVPTHEPSRRVVDRRRPMRSIEAKWRAVTAAAAEHHAAGRPVLVGTRSVEDSELLSGLLSEAGLPHDVLNARSHEREAAIVAEAGQPGRVTVATNMAGRGTDIKLGPGVAERGGLVVIATDRQESPRVDRQLVGRAARQGDPGLAVEVTSLDDHVLKRFAPRLRRVLRAAYPLLPGAVLRRAASYAQRRAARLGTHQRRQVQLRDEHLADQTGF